jgi:hypothetical protein
MSFNRLRYDDCATKLHNKRSVGIGEYRLSFDNVENNNQCYSLTGPIGSKSDTSTAKNNCSINWGEMTQIELKEIAEESPQVLADGIRRCGQNVFKTHKEESVIA